MAAAVETLIGRSVRRTDGELKVRGEAVFAIDHEEPRMLQAAILRSPIPAGRIKRLDTSKAERMPGVHAVVTGADTSARAGWVIRDQPLLARDRVHFAGEPIAAVAAETLGQVYAAIRAIELELEPEPAVTDVEAALAPGAPLVHPDWESFEIIIPGPRSGPGGNVAWEGTVDRGDPDADFARGDVVVVEDEFVVPRQHQAYIEPRAAVAKWENGRCVVHTTTQGLYNVRDRVAAFCAVPVSRVRVVMTVVGGGFGGKVDFHLEPFCALLSRKAGGAAGEAGEHPS